MMSDATKVAMMVGCIRDQSWMAPDAKREAGFIRKIVHWCNRHGITMHSMTCPETELIGLGRPKHGLKWYEEHGLRPVARTIAEQEARYFEQLGNVIVIFCMEHSPSCSGGFMYQGRKGNVRQDGIYIQELKKAIEARGLKLPPFISYNKNAPRKLAKQLAELLK